MRIKEFILVYLKGVGMGTADVIPGVSGGTIAFITGIYERLINAIKSFNLTAIKLLFKGKIKQFWKHIDATFLLCLVAGIATSFLSLAKVITHLIETHPVFLWAFFFGLVLASAIFVGKDVKWNWKTILSFLFFCALAFYVTSPERAPVQTDSAYWYIFICGAVAICAMILPGISGSFILLLMGEYYVMMKALNDLNLPIILVFICGAVIGLLTFSNVLSWLFKRAKMITLASLTGFMLGSLNKIWPWKKTLEELTDDHGKVVLRIQENILPNETHGSLFLAIGLIIFGLSIIFIIEMVAKKITQMSKKS